MRAFLKCFCCVYISRRRIYNYGPPARLTRSPRQVDEVHTRPYAQFREGRLPTGSARPSPSCSPLLRAPDNPRPGGGIPSQEHPHDGSRPVPMEPASPTRSQKGYSAYTAPFTRSTSVESSRNHEHSRSSVDEASRSVSASIPSSRAVPTAPASSSLTFATGFAESVSRKRSRPASTPHADDNVCAVSDVDQSQTRVEAPTSCGDSDGKSSVEAGEKFLPNVASNANENGNTNIDTASAGLTDHLAAKSKVQLQSGIAKYTMVNVSASSPHANRKDMSASGSDAISAGGMSSHARQRDSVSSPRHAHRQSTRASDIHSQQPAPRLISPPFRLPLPLNLTQSPPVLSPRELPSSKTEAPAPEAPPHSQASDVDTHQRKRRRILNDTLLDNMEPPSVPSSAGTNAAAVYRSQNATDNESNPSNALATYRSHRPTRAASTDRSYPPTSSAVGSRPPKLFLRISPEVAASLASKSPEDREISQSVNSTSVGSETNKHAAGRHAKFTSVARRNGAAAHDIRTTVSRSVDVNDSVAKTQSHSTPTDPIAKVLASPKNSGEALLLLAKAGQQHP